MDKFAEGFKIKTLVLLILSRKSLSCNVSFTKGVLIKNLFAIRRKK